MVNEDVLYMVDGKFTVEKELAGPTLLSIRIRPEVTENFDPHSMESTAIWVDNRRMTLTGEKGNFEYSDVSGYWRQDEHEKSEIFVKEMLARHKRKIDSLSNLQTASAKRELKQIASISNVYLMNKYKLDYAYQYPHSFISVYNYSWFIKWIPEMGPKSHALEFHNSLGDSLKHSQHGAQIKNYIENIAVNRKLNLGDHPYEFSLPDSSGTEISLTSLKGKIILLDFWASNCGPCRREHKNYVNIYEKYKSQGFEILSVSQDKMKNQWLKAMVKDSITWSSVWDKSMDISKYKYLVSAIPDNYLINRDGIIIGKDLRGDELRTALSKLFGN